MRTRTIKVDYLARVEGEGALYVKVHDGVVDDVRLKIFEPPRFFEALLRGREYSEAPDITARICGICPVAYQIGATHAMENALGVSVDPQVRALRRLLYCGEWIESHVLHVAMLHAPDFLGYQDAIAMAGDHPDIVQTALRLKKLGNDIMTTIGGREIHPVSVRIGGFYKVPERRDLVEYLPRLATAREEALALVRFTATLPFPDFEQDYLFVALHHPDEYAITEGRLISSRGLDIGLDEYDRHFTEEHVRHSNALHSSTSDGDNYMVGPLARFALNYDQLSPLARQAATEAGLDRVCRNPFKSIIVRAVETLYAIEEAERIIGEYVKPEHASVAVTPRAGTGYGCTEAPRGICYHRYRLDDGGLITDAKIVPPTSQNQKTIESDLRAFVPQYLDLDNDMLTWRCEQAVRNYDPCISCATHFLRLEVVRD
ncbi:MAG TPA: Ni/Fe hydrogenase subunit alpha [Candidatus Kapabacteria bacterium]|jgi:coenzyme F420-reducing hydrogenase alpha subunit|nr:Ni/Fe hydrogenase subunit alpha [Candidatus Kapabacteria bacterium]HVK37715.1 Ni/Fe hydrogenase subunit alpha [Candidatus Kapabacteria bacterium]